jgi:hypothetical protein
MCPRTFSYNIYSLVHGVWVMEVKTFAFLIPHLTTYLAWRIGLAALPTLLWPPRAFCKLLVRTTYTFDMSMYLPHTSPFSLGFPFSLSFPLFIPLCVCEVPMGSLFSFPFTYPTGTQVSVYVKSNLPVLVYLGWAGLARRGSFGEVLGTLEPRGDHLNHLHFFCRIRITAAFPFFGKEKNGEGVRDYKGCE